MELFIRYLSKTNKLPNKFATKAYDLRIFYILNGEGKIIINGESNAIAKGAFCYCPTGTEYYPISSYEKPLDFIVINFDLSTKNKHRQKTVGTVKSDEFDNALGIFSQDECEVELYKNPFIISNAHFIEEILLTTEKEYKKHTVYAREIAQSYLKCALLKLAEFKSQKGNYVYNKIVDFIENNYKNIKSNENVSEALGYHPFYLSKVIKQHSGLTLNRYIKKLRLAKAAELLALSDMSITEISNKIGIENANHFCNIFTKEYGMPPSAYRNSIKIV